MRKSHTLRSVIVGTLLASAISVPAFAQDESTGIDEIIITAEKRKASLQDTAISITAFDADMKDTLGMIGAGDIANFTPGMTYIGSPNRISIRGVGRMTNALGTEPGVAIYRDGVYTNEAASVSDNTFMSDEVSVLRGPQILFGRNAVGGAAQVTTRRPTEEFEGRARASVGSFDDAVIGLALSGPLTDNFRVLAAFTRDQGGHHVKNIGTGNDGGGFEGDRYTLAFTLDVSENLTWWLNFENNDWDMLTHSGGEIDPMNTSGSLYGGKGGMSNCFGWAPGIFGATPYSPYFSGATIGAVIDLNGTSMRGCDFNWLDGDFSYAETMQNASFGQPDRPVDPFVVDTDLDSRIVTISNTWTSHVTWNTERWEFKHIFGTTDYDWYGVWDGDGTSRKDVQYWFDIRQKEEAYQNHLTAVSDLGGNIEFIFGAFQFHDEIAQPIFFKDLDPDSVLKNPYAWDFQAFGAPGNVWPGVPNPEAIAFYQTGEVITDSWAVYGQTDFYVNDQIHIAAGLRYTEDEKEGYEEMQLTYDGMGTFGYLWQNETWWSALPIPFGGAGVPLEGGEAHVALDLLGGVASDSHTGSWDSLDWSLGIDYKPNDDVMYYVKVATGYKAGGFKLGSLADDAATPDVNEAAVDKEELIAYEIGYKASMADNRFQLNAAAYFNDYSDFQAPVTAIVSGQTITRLVNAKKAEQWGVEADATWMISDSWTLMGTYAHMNTEITDFGGTISDDTTGHGCWAVDPLCTLAGNEITPAVPYDPTGNELLSSPSNTFSLNSIHNWVINDESELGLAVTYAYTGERWSSIHNRDRAYDVNPTQVPSNYTLNARLTYSRPDEGIRIALYGRNLTDELIHENITRGDRVDNNIRDTSTRPPRTFGIQIDVTF